ncbi:MAG: carboxypeptidase-like regulatory domain-containing protein [Flammeovirgaceae bacterium]
MAVVFATWHCAYGQKFIKGIVVDSATLTNLAGVHVLVKGTNRATSTNNNGVFTVLATEKDTLIFTYVGYAREKLAVHLEDETMFVRMREESILLKEVVVKDRFMLLNERYIKSPTLQSSKPLKAAGFSQQGGVGVNFSYFSKQEKEKRKLGKIMAENEMVRVYMEMTNDSDLKDEIMARFKIDEDQFYDLLAIYNEKHKDIMYSSNSGLILNSLLSYYQEATKN